MASSCSRVSPGHQADQVWLRRRVRCQHDPYRNHSDCLRARPRDRDGAERCNVVGVLPVSGDRSRGPRWATLHRTGFWSSSIQIRCLQNERVKRFRLLINGMSWSPLRRRCRQQPHMASFQREDFRVRVRDFLVTSTAASAASLASQLNCMVLSRTATASASYSVLACTPSCALLLLECCFGPSRVLLELLLKVYTLLSMAPKCTDQPSAS